jgi:16S rRNA (cytosine967-C5)-methyltransferase
VALQALERMRAGDLADRALERAATGLDPRERALAQEMVYGVSRLRGRLDHLLGQLVRSGVDSLEPEVLDVLRLGVYQLTEMDGVPPYAAVSQSVDLARQAGSGRAGGLVNGVLQNLQRRRGSLGFPDAVGDPVGFLTTHGSHPGWLVERWLARFGAEEAAALVAADNTRPELYLRPLGMTVDQARERLAEQGMESEPVALAPDSLRLLPPAGAAQALAAVPGVVQDPAAALVVRYAEVPERSVTLDLCAAPGGKALGLAERAGRVVAADLSPRRLGRVAENAARVGWSDRVAAVVADGLYPPFGPVEAVLLDAPCTGTGTFRRHPDGRWRITQKDLAELASLQRELLASAAELVRPGGLLVYATCSLEPEENEVQMQRFLEAHPGWRVEAPEAPLLAELVGADGCLRVLPQRHGVDGAFAARLRRAA